MRKFLIPMLMASVLMPAAAYADPGDRGVRAHGEQSESNDNSSRDRPQRAQHSERSSSDAPRVDRAERPVRVERGGDQVQATEPAGVRAAGRQRTAEPVQEVRRVERREVTQPVQVVRRTERRDGDNGFVSGIQQLGRDEAARQRGEVVVHRDGDRDRDGDHRWDRDRDGDHRWDRDRDGDRRWSSDWRRDSRYNWYGYRNSHRTLFRLGRYFDPYGWNYRRFSIGLNLSPSYYGSNFWLNDPWQYRLPPAYGPYRWVRYYNDALLVNIYTGQVVDLIHNVFW